MLVTVVFGMSASVPGDVRVLTNNPVSEPMSWPVNATKAVSNDPSRQLPHNRQKASVARQRIAPIEIEITTIVMTRRDVDGIAKFTSGTN